MTLRQTLFALVLLPMTAFARGPHGGPGHHGDRPDPMAFFEENAVEMQLTDAQLDQLQAIFEARRQQMEARMQEFKARGERPTEAEREAIHAEMQEGREAIRQQVAQVLTDDQRAYVRENMERPDRGGHGPGFGRGPGKGAMMLQMLTDNADELGLSQADLDGIEANMQSLEGTMRPLFEAHGPTIKAGMESDATDAEIAAAEDAKAILREAHQDNLEVLLADLSPAKRKRVAAFLEEKREEHRGERGGRGGR